jgi:hypothetical protein
MAEALYVVLQHEGIAQPHFDLMFQTAPGSMLATWRAETWPISGVAALEKLPDHRQAYLTFEGEISGNRGTVRRVEQGICMVENSDQRWTIHLRALPSGKSLILQLDQLPDGKWIGSTNS